MIGAEEMLHQISEIRASAEQRIRRALNEKHFKEVFIPPSQTYS